MSLRSVFFQVTNFRPYVVVLSQILPLRALRQLQHHFVIAAAVRDFAPHRLKSWIQGEAKLYFQATKADRFKLHNLRGTAMSKARMAGVIEDDAAIAFGCTPQTMREHYLALDEESISDDVFVRIHSGGAKEAQGKIGAINAKKTRVTCDVSPFVSTSAGKRT